jgi:hypothetical protein
MAYGPNQPPNSDPIDLERGLQGSSDPLSPTFGGSPYLPTSQTSAGASVARPEVSLHSPAFISQAKISALNLDGSTPVLPASPPPFSAKPSPSSELPTLPYNQTTTNHTVTKPSPAVSLAAVEKVPNEKVIEGSVVPASSKPVPVAAKPKSKPPKIEASRWIRFNLFFNTYR